MGNPKELSWSREILGAQLGVLLLMIVAYLPSLNADYFSVDDNSLITFPPQVQCPLDSRSFTSIFTPGTHIDYYPIRDLSYVLDSCLWPDSKTGARLHQIILFWMTGFLAFLLLTELGIQAQFAAFMTMFWEIHPIHAELLMWLSSRKDLLALFFGMGASWLFVRGLKRDQKPLLVAAVLIYAASLLSKASLTLLPMAGLLGAFLGVPPLKSIRARNILLIATTLAILSGLGQSWFYSHVNNMTNQLSALERIESSAIGLGKSVTGLILPSVNVVETDTFGEWVLRNRLFVLPGVLAWIFLALGFLTALRKRARFPLFMISMTIALYLPVSGLIFSHRTFYSTRYFEAMFLAIMLWGVAPLSALSSPKQIQYIKGVFLVMLCLAAYGTIQEGAVWSSSVSVRQKAFRFDPGSISTRGYLLGDIINAMREHQQPEEIVLLRNSLVEGIQHDCMSYRVPSSPVLSGPPPVNCMVPYRHAYYLSRWKNRNEEAQDWLRLLRAAASGLHPIPKMMDRLEFEHALFTGYLNIEKVRQWRDDNRILPDPSYRMLDLISGCLLGAYDSKSGSKKYSGFIENRLLTNDYAKKYLNENLSAQLTPKIKACLGLQNHATSSIEPSQLSRRDFNVPLVRL